MDINSISDNITNTTIDVDFSTTTGVATINTPNYWDSDEEDAREFAEFLPSIPIEKESGDITPTPSSPRKKINTRKEKTKNKRMPVRFIVGSSRIDQLRNTQQNHPTDSTGIDMTEYSTNGKHIIPCRNITQKDGNWGCCEREWCDFAHSFKDLKDPLCRYGDNCRIAYKCKFRHLGENREAFYSRTGNTIPKVAPAEDHDKVRKPTKKNTSVGDIHKNPSKERNTPSATKSVSSTKKNHFIIPAEMVSVIVDMMAKKGITDYSIEVKTIVD